MYKIRPYSEFLQEELLKFIKECPYQWQAKVLLLLEFKTVLTLDELIIKSNISEIYILKALLIAEQYSIVLRMAEGWILNAVPNIDNLNYYLSLDISDLDLENNDSLKILLADKDKEYIHKGLSSKQAITNIQPSSSKLHLEKSKPSYDDIPQEQRLLINDRGRKRSDEWNSNEALKLNRQLRDRIKKINEEKALEKTNDIGANKTDNVKKKHYSSKSEKLYIELCLDFPEYEDYITRHHNLNSSYKTMEDVKKKYITILI